MPAPKSRKKAASSPRRRPPAKQVPSELDDMNMSGNDEFPGEALVLAMRGDRAWFRPVAFDRLDADHRDLATQLMLLVAQRRNLAADIEDLVQHMRSHGISWGVIGWAVGTSSEAARQRWTENAQR